ncbi:MAG: TonB family protein [Cyanobacteria bacterium J06638_6]
MVNRAMKMNFRGPRSHWQRLLAPMLLASLGLHALILMLPAGSSNEAVIPPPDPEQDTVAITRIPPAGTPDTATTPLVTATPGGAVAPASPAAPAPATAPQRAAVPPRSRPTQPSPQPTTPPSSPAPPPATNDGSTPEATTPVPPPPPTSPLFGADIGEGLLAYIAALNLPQSQVDRAAESIANRFAFDANAVTRDTLNANQQQWEATIQQETGQADLSPEIHRTDFATVYPQRVCLSNEPGDITIGALVNPDGTWLGEPVLLRSSGYGALDQKALDEIQRHRFAAADGIKAYTLTVETTVDYGPRPCIEPNPDV